MLVSFQLGFRFRLQGFKKVLGLGLQMQPLLNGNLKKKIQTFGYKQGQAFPWPHLFIYLSLPCFATLLFCCSFSAPLHGYSLTSLLPCFENIFHNQQSSLAPSLAIPFFATSLFCCSLFHYSLLLYLLTLLDPCFITVWFIIFLLHCTLCFFTAPLLCCALASLLPHHHFKYLSGLPLLLQSPLLHYFTFGCFLSKSILPISPSLLQVLVLKF